MVTHDRIGEPAGTPLQIVGKTTRMLLRAMRRSS
jgi:hypothetical protein